MDDDNLCVRLVAILAWSEPSARMIDVGSFLGHQKSPACFVSARALESQLSCCQERQRACRSSRYCFTNKGKRIPIIVLCAGPAGRNRFDFPGFTFWPRNSVFLLLLFPLSSYLGWQCSALLLLRSGDIALSSIMTKPADWPMNNCYWVELYCWVYGWVKLCPYDSIKTEMTAMYFDLLGC